MQIVSFDDNTFNLPALSEQVQNQIASNQFAETELALIQAKAASFQTERMTQLGAIQAVPTAIGGCEILKLCIHPCCYGQHKH